MFKSYVSKIEIDLSKIAHFRFHGSVEELNIFQNHLDVLLVK